MGFVKILIGAGIYGIGEATLEMRERTVETAIQESGRYLAGRDPYDVAACRPNLYLLL